MNTNWTTWHRPNGSPRWHSLGEVATEAEADALMFNCRESGAFYVCAPGRTPPTPQAAKPAKPVKPLKRQQGHHNGTKELILPR